MKGNLKEKVDEVILTICPNCGWFWVRESNDEIVCKKCLEKLKEEFGGSEEEFKDWLKEKLTTNLILIKNKLHKSESGLLRVRDVCWGCGHTQSVVFYKDREYWRCVVDRSKNFCGELMKIIHAYFQSLLANPIKLRRITKYAITKKGRVRVFAQTINVISESENEKIEREKEKRGLFKWIG
jgi:ribosomal protein S27E